MKNLLIVSAMLVSASAIGDTEKSGVDYSKCQRGAGFGGASIQPDGSILPPFGMKSNPDIKTIDGANGEKELIYEFSSQGLDSKGKPTKHQFKIKKDANGNIISASNVQDKVSEEMIKYQKEWMLQTAVYSGIPMNSQDQYPQNSFLSNPKIKEMRKEFKEKIRDTKSLNKIREGYSRFIDKSDLFIPNGSKIDMEIVNGTCQVKNVQMFSYDVKNKVNVISQNVNGDFCRQEIQREKEVRKKYQKYDKQLSECHSIEFQMNQELNGQPFPGGIVGGSSGGIVGGSSSGSIEEIGGAVGGYGAIGGPGIGGLISGGFYGIGGPISGGYYGIGGPGIGGPGIGGPGIGGPGMFSMNFQCQMFFGDPLFGEGPQPGFNGSSMGGQSDEKSQSKATDQ
jgi:hypothetical protein